LNGLERATRHGTQTVMKIAPRKPMTLTEFLAWEERQELRYEFDGFESVAMTGGTIAHDQITFDLRTALAGRLAGKRTRPLGPNVKVIVDGRARYPDALVVCRPVSPGATVADDPVIVFEVLSEGTSETDLIDKNRISRDRVDPALCGPATDP
jgi:Uma2 family endonuclease